MNSAQVIDLLNELEARYPVAGWWIGDILVWPIIRGRLYYAIIHFYLLSADQHPLAAASLWQRFMSTPRNLWRLAGAIIRDARHNRLRFRRADALFLSDGTSFANIEGAWHDRIMGPVAARLSARQMSSFAMSPGWLSLTPRNQPSMLIQPQLEIRKIFATLFRKLAGDPANNLEGMDAMLAELQRQEYGAVIPGRQWVFSNTARIKAQAAFFARALRKVQPRMAFVNTYYAAEGLALCLACRRAGIPVADIQHGSQGRDHMAYGRWNALPPGGYDLLPDRFWCWGEDDAAAITEWAAGTRHAPFIAGDAWRRIWREGREPFVVRLRKHAQALRGKQNAPYHALVVLSWGFDEDVTLNTFRALARLPADKFFWWIRLHPAERGKEREMARKAWECGLSNFEVVEASTLPLYAVFAAIDLVVALASTVVMEAEDWGLRSVITTEYGRDICKPSICSGAAVVATQADSIAKAVNAALAKGPLPVAAGATNDNLDAALDDLIRGR